MLYLDNASTTKPNDKALQTFLRISQDNWFNPANIYTPSLNCAQLITDARAKVAKMLNCSPSEIFFTSGSSEGNSFICNQADTVYTSLYEHANYQVNPKVKAVADDFLQKAVKTNRLQGKVYSHMLVNNLTGIVYNVRPLFLLAKECKMLTACDITQAIGHIPVDLKELGCDFAVASAHKFGGLKGNGILYISKDAQEIKPQEIKPLVYGTQERGIRGGTSNTAGIVSTAVALEEAVNKMEVCRMNNIQSRSIVYSELERNGVEFILPWANLKNDDNSVSTISNIAAFFLKGIESEVLQAMLADEEIYIGTSSACCTGEMGNDPVLEALGVGEEYIRGFVRISFAGDESIGDVKYMMRRLVEQYRVIRGEE